MDEKSLRNLLKLKNETDWLDFKQGWNLFDADGKLIKTEQDELIKDILGLANGNSHNVRKTKYLIIGAENSRFDSNGLRILHDVNYRVPTQSEITQWVNGACTPSIVGIECDWVTINEKRLYVVTIPPTFDLHETTRDLNAKGHYSKYAVLMRQDEHTTSASVKEGVVIQQLKLLYRQEVSNPSAVRSGFIYGAILALLFWNAGKSFPPTNNSLISIAAQCFITVLGAILGAELGWIYQQFNSARYDWRYMVPRERMLLILALVIIIGAIVGSWYLLRSL